MTETRESTTGGAPEHMKAEPAGTAPVRILQVLGGLDRGGAESRILDLYRHLDRSRVQFDFLVHVDEAGTGNAAEGNSSDALMAVRTPQDLDAEVKALGGRIYALPRFTGRNYLQYRAAARRFFAEHAGEWAAVEGHMTSTAAIYLKAARSAGVPVAASHARSAGVTSGLKGKMTRFLQRRLPGIADPLLSCTEEAGLAVYGERAVAQRRVRVVPNAIPLEDLSFQPSLRPAERETLGFAEDTVVLGHVGRFDDMKNQAFLVKALAALRSTGGDYRLLLVGDGRERPAVEAAVREAGLERCVVFAGRQPREKVAALYQAMDVFCLPSLYEGMPGTVVEASAAGLPCLVSDRITPEVCLTPTVEQLPIQEGCEALWAAKIREMGLGTGTTDREEQSHRNLQDLAAKGYEVKTLAREMQAFYESCAKPRLMLVCPMLHQGGFERILVRTARLLANEAKVDIVLFDDADIAYDIRGLSVRTLQLGSVPGRLGKLIRILRRSRALAREKRRLHAERVYSFGSTANLACALAGGPGIQVSGLRSFQDFDHPRQLRFILRGSDRVACCSEGIREKVRTEYADCLGEEGAKPVFTLYNPIPLPSEETVAALRTAPIPGPDNAAALQVDPARAAAETEEFIRSHRPLIITMGREDDIKGYWHLIRGFADAVKSAPETLCSAGLLFVGDGSFDEYKTLAAALGVADRVRFAGLYKDPFPLLSRADLYVLSSMMEGFPNALVEAMSLGIPAVSTDCPTGPAEILGTEEEAGGILIPNFALSKDLDPAKLEPEEKALSEALTQLLGDADRREKMAADARRRAADFSEEAYVARCRQEILA